MGRGEEEKEEEGRDQMRGLGIEDEKKIEGRGEEWERRKRMIDQKKEEYSIR